MKKYSFARARELHRTSPTFLLTMWFAILLLAGTILLWLPVAHHPGGSGVSFLTALFTAVSAFCVTGLVVVDTPEAFSLFGQVVILVLIQLGGLGIMTFAALGFSMMGRRMSLAGHAALTDSLFHSNPATELKILFPRMVKTVFFVQLIGVIFLYIALLLHPVESGPDTPGILWSAVFHSVSAFCNAGFSIYPGNLELLGDNPHFLLAIMLMVVAGGLGHGVLAELQHLPLLLFSGEKRPRRLTANTRVVLWMTGIMLVLGAGGMMAADYFHAPGSRMLDSLFHSVVARTAGFNSAPMGAVPLPSCLILCLLMFVGGAPGSCAGGIKVTSLAIWVARIRSALRQDQNVSMMGYSIPTHLLTKSRVIIALSTLWVLAGTLVLAFSEPDASLEVLLFEQISAFATVGFSLGLTPDLNAYSQVWLIISMIMGKFGPLTILLWVLHPVTCQVRRPEGNILVG